jgi:hypothetical protein
MNHLAFASVSRGVVVAFVFVTLGCDPVPWYRRTLSLDRAPQRDCVLESARQLGSFIVSEKEASPSSYAIALRTADGDTHVSVYVARESDSLVMLQVVGARRLKCSRDKQLREKEAADALLERVRVNCAPAEVSSKEDVPECS